MINEPAGTDLQVTSSFDLWLGKDDSSYFELLGRQREGEALELTHEQVVAAFGGDEDDGFQGYGYLINFMEEEGIAVINIEGSMSNKETVWARYFGIPSYEGITGALLASAMHDGVKGVILNWDSPGGTTRGISKPTDTIKELTKAGLPVFSYAAGSMMSGAVWIGGAAERVYAAKDSEIGSVGVLAIHRDLTKYYEDLGVKHTLMRSGEYKALVNPYEKLSDKAKEVINNRLSSMHSQFVSVVAQNTGQSEAVVRTKIANGKEFSAQEAKDLQLVDKITTFDEAVSAMVKRIERKQSTKPTHTYGVNTNMAEIDPKAAAASVTGATGLTIDAAADALAKKGIKPEEPPESQEEATPAAAAEGGSEAGEETAETAGAEESAETGSEAPPAASAAPAADTSAIVGLLTEANKQVTNLTVENTKLAAENETLKAAVTGYRRITTEAVGRMRVGLGRPASVEDLKEAPEATVIAAYEGLVGEVMKAFPSSQQSKTQEGEGTKVKNSALSQTMAKVTKLSAGRSR